MPFTEIRFSSMEEFFAIMRRTKPTFVLFCDGSDSRLGDALPLSEDEAGYFVTVRVLNKECFDRLMKNSPVELRADPVHIGTFGISKKRLRPEIRMGHQHCNCGEISD